MFSRLSVRLTAAACVAALGVAALGATAPELKFTDTKLKNGLRVIIHEDHTAPVYSIAVVYNAGSRDERQGRTGFAHLFEHMMFKGSENVGLGEHFVLVFRNGGSMNGTTNEDRTLYYETLPSNQLDLGLFLEADRMRSLEITKTTSTTSATPFRRSAGRVSTISRTASPLKHFKSSRTTALLTSIP